MDILYFWNYYNLGRRILNRFIKSPKSLPQIDETQIEEINKTNQDLYHFFTEKESLMTMTYAILEIYPEQNIKVLTQFVGQSYPPFADWISHIMPKNNDTEVITKDTNILTT
jgi:hypothetical protein